MGVSRDWGFVAKKFTVATGVAIWVSCEDYKSHGICPGQIQAGVNVTYTFILTPTIATIATSYIEDIIEDEKESFHESSSNDTTKMIFE